MKKRIISMLLVLCMVLAFIPAGITDVQAAETQSQDSAKRDNTTIHEPAGTSSGIITRAQWVQKLVEAFDMTVEEAHAPDNYFNDLTGDEDYYRDILVAVQFGVVDIPAGEAFRPNDAATREFAAQTLNSCLGFLRNEGEGYTFSEASTVTYPDDIQISIDRGWFALSGSNFLPQQAITEAEEKVMLADIEQTLASRVIDTNYKNSYTFSTDVIEIPQGTDVEVVQDTVTIRNNPKTIKNGDVFIVWYNGVPCAYIANRVTKSGDTTTINVTAVEDDSAIVSADAQGVLDTEFVQFVPAEGTEIVYVDEVTGEEYTDARQADAAIASHNAKRGTKKLMTLQLKSEIDLGSGLSASVSVKLKDPVLEYKISSKSKTAYVTLTADYEFSISAKAELIENVAVKKLRLGFWGCPGIGGIELAMVYSLAGNVTGTYTGTMCVGADYTSGAGFSIPKSFHSKGFSLVIEASLKAGLQVNLGINDIPGDLLSGYVYAEVGAKGSVKRTSYSDNTAPKTCVQTAMYLYLECGAKLTFKVGTYKSEYSREYKIWKDSNSPVRVVHHYEDGKEVCQCSRGNVYDNGYYTVGTSNYWGSGWSGGSGGTGYDKYGNPISVFNYTVDEDGNATITKYNGSGASVTIPETIDGHTVTVIGSYAFDDCTSLQTISIPDSVTRIEYDAFRNCANLSGLILPRHLVSLGTFAFSGCKEIKVIEIPKSLESASGAFSNSGLEKVTFEAGTTSVLPGIFDGAENLSNVELLSTMTTIGNYAFDDCTSLQTISIPDSVIKIEHDAFRGCTSLKQILIPDTTTDIGTNAFSGCTSLEEVKLPSCHQNIATGMFQNCSSLKAIDLPESVTTISGNAFSGCTQLTEIDYKNVEIIESCAFKNCTSLKNIKLYSSLTSIGSKAFQNCTSLASVEIPASVASIGSYIFDGCEVLKEVKLGSGLTKIPERAFSNCGALESIVIPYRVEEIGANAFLNDVKLTSVTIPRRTAKIASNAFSYPDKLTIYGVAGTYAETYAGEIGAKFVAIDKPATGVTLNETAVRMNKGATIQLVATVAPVDFTDETAWKSSDPSVATVTDAGAVKAVGIGECTVSFVAGNMKASCKITVVQPVTSISLNKTSLSLDAGETFKLTASVYPNNAENKEITWSSSDETIATVNENGVVTALKKGNATITATANDGSGVQKSCAVTVKGNLYVVSNVADLQSPHPYTVNCNDIWQYSVPGATQLNLTFSADTSMESGSDYIYIYSADGTLVGKYTGIELAGKTIAVPGGTVKIKLVSDGTYCEYGFAVTSVTTQSEPHTHNYTSVVTSPTCTEQGYTTHTCTVCGDSYKDTYTAALGHAWDNGKVTTQPTETAEGVKTFTCTRCDATRTESIPATGDKPCDGGEGCPSGKFVDVNPKKWYHPYVDYAVTHGLFGGTSKNTFEPETAMTRAMLVTVLWRYEGQPKGYENTFTDVNAKSGSWYIDAVAWAAANGVVNGVGNGKFDPQGKVTREQMAAILFRYAQKKGIDTSKRDSLGAFPDATMVSTYAKDAMQWAVAEKIINGSDGKLLPKGNATRAQVATILMRFIENIVNQ